MSAGAILGGASIGAGVGVSSVALAPFNAANTFMGSAFFGYGMILGERYMYQADWPKIQARLEHGEQIENIIQEYTGTFTAVVMKEAKIIFETVTREFIAIMNEALRGAIPAPVQQPTEGPTIGDPRRTPAPETPETIRVPAALPAFKISATKIRVDYTAETERQVTQIYKAGIGHRSASASAKLHLKTLLRNVINLSNTIQKMSKVFKLTPSLSQATSLQKQLMKTYKIMRTNQLLIAKLSITYKFN